MRPTWAARRRIRGRPWAALFVAALPIGLGLVGKSCSLPRRSRRASGNPGRLAQLVEHLAYTERVGGSSPSPPTSPLGALVRGRAALSAFCAAAACVWLLAASPAAAEQAPMTFRSVNFDFERLRRRLPAGHRRRRRHRGRDAAGLRRFRQAGVAIAAAAQRHLHEFAGRQRRRVDGARRRLPPAARRGGRRRLRFGRVAFGTGRRAVLVGLRLRADGRDAAGGAAGKPARAAPDVARGAGRERRRPRRQAGWSRSSPAMRRRWASIRRSSGTPSRRRRARCTSFRPPKSPAGGSPRPASDAARRRRRSAASCLTWRRPWLIRSAPLRGSSSVG